MTFTTAQWTKRPREEANLLNPAFLGLLIERAAHGYHEISGDGLQWPLPYLVLPAVLHKQTREALPKDRRTSMVEWTGRTPCW